MPTRVVMEFVRTSAFSGVLNEESSNAISYEGYKAGHTL